MPKKKNQILLTGLSYLYKTRTTNIRTSGASRSLTRPGRNNDSEAMILLAVVVASPDKIRLEGTYRKVKTPSGTVNRYRNPASLAMLRGDVWAVGVVI